MNKNQKNRILVIAAISCFLSISSQELVAKKASTTGVPGIDSLPSSKILTDDGTVTEEIKKTNSIDDKGQKVQNNINVQDTPEVKKQDTNNLQLPFINNLKVTPEKSRPHSVKISWDVSKQNSTAIYVARYVRPLQNRKLVLDADLVTLRPLSPGATSFVDYNIPDGTYYYVVATSFEMSTSQRLILKPGVNYTTSPTVIYRKKETISEKVNNDYHVRNLYAVNTKSSVALSWTPVGTKNISYNIYKSYQPISIDADLQLAHKLREVSSGVLKFTDTNPIEGRDTWYLVSVTDRQTGREYKRFVINQNLIRNKFKKNSNSDERLKLIPSTLTPFLEAGNSIKLLWNDPVVRIPELAIFRASSPIISVANLRQATHIANVKYGVSEYRDSNLSKGTYFYAVLPKKSQKNLVGIFVAGNSFTSFGMRIFDRTTQTTETQKKPKVDTTKDSDKNSDKVVDSNTDVVKPRVAIRFLRAKSKASNSINVSWSLKKTKTSLDELDFHYLLYRAKEKIRNYEDLDSIAEFVEEFDSETTHYLDSGLEPGKYYYALVIDSEGKIDPKLIVGKNYLRYPVKIKKTETIVKQTTKKQEQHTTQTTNKKQQQAKYSLKGLNRILARTYHEKRYTASIRQIAPYVHATNISASLRARALFYTGLSYYSVKRYQASLEYFVDTRVRRFFPERSRFWYNRCIEKTGRLGK